MNIEDNAEVNVSAAKTPLPNTVHMVAGLLCATKEILDSKCLRAKTSSDASVADVLESLVDAHYFHSVAVSEIIRESTVAEVNAITLGQLKSGAPIAIGLLLAVKTTLLTYGVKTRIKLGNQQIDVVAAIDLIIGALTGISGQTGI